MQVAMGKRWELMYEAIQMAVESVHNQDVRKEQLQGGTRASRRGVTVNALLAEGSVGYTQRGRSPSSDGSRSDYRSRL